MPTPSYQHNLRFSEAEERRLLAVAMKHPAAFIKEAVMAHIAALELAAGREGTAPKSRQKAQRGQP